MKKIEKGDTSPINGYIITEKEYKQYTKDKEVLNTLEHMMEQTT